MPYVASIGTYLPCWGAPAPTDLLPMAFAECAASVDKGMVKTDVRVLVRRDGNRGRLPMTLADVHAAEVHDFFTGIELISYEDLGFAERFGGYKLVEAEVTSVGGACR